MTSGFNNAATSYHYQLLIIAVIFILSFLASLGIQTKKH
ncbi:hypothetical protein Nizo2801_2424 [Lactiplantibacillus plantarum]|nr:hypothetical protein Nizo2801_2424 [Lactiplantibacillus plantarum]